MTTVPRDAWTRTLERVSRRCRGRRALVLVVFDGEGGHVVADLPLLRISFCETCDQVEILLGDRDRPIYRTFNVWEVEALEVAEPGSREPVVRLRHPGGRTIILLPPIGGGSPARDRPRAAASP